MWNKPQTLVCLKSSLDKDVANILWDYDKEEISSLSGLTRILKNRYGGKSFAEKHLIDSGTGDVDQTNPFRTFTWISED